MYLSQNIKNKEAGMEKNIGIALLCVAGVILLGLIARFPYAVWVVVDLGAIIVCAVSGFKLLKKQ